MLSVKRREDRRIVINKWRKEGKELFIARQPIFNRIMNIYGYELLFRSDAKQNTYRSTNPVSATATVLGGLFENGIDRVVGRAKAFVNFDYEFLMSDVIELISPDTLVIEVLETVKEDEALLERIKSLRKAGYQIALDDFSESVDSYPMIPIADIIKYDILATPLDSIETEVSRALSRRKIILAEKIETEEDYQKAHAMGFHLFQGYFFSKPKVIGGSVIQRPSRIQYTQIFTELRKAEPSFDTLATIIESDVGLAYRLLKVMSNKRTENFYPTIKKALLIMGLQELERWVNIMMLQERGEEKPLELVLLSVVRSKFSEYLAVNSKFRKRKDEILMMCLFSTLDAILDQPMDEALDGMMLPQDVYDALVYKKGALKPICDLVLAYEHGNWTEVSRIAAEIELDTEGISDGYIEATQWAFEISASFEDT